jgi:SAM-dependent methyltransferase
MWSAAFAGPAAAGLVAAGSLLSEGSEILLQRVVSSSEPPAWLCNGANDDAFSWLADLSEDDLICAERDGLFAFMSSRRKVRPAPPFLTRLAARASQTSSLFPLDGAMTQRGPLAKRPRRVSPAKHHQIHAVVQAAKDILASLPVSRIVDVGGGHGHLARELALVDEAMQVVCVDLNPALLRMARELYEHQGSRGTLTFVQGNAVASDSLFGNGDLIIGLHPCGSLGDRIVLAAAEHTSALVLVSCCLQKLQGGDAALRLRSPVSATAKSNPVVYNALRADAKTLGVTNRVRGFAGGSDLLARETRVALRMLLSSRGHAVGPISDVSGLSRHRMRRGIRAVAEQALEARGDKTPVSHDEIDTCVMRAHEEYVRMRKLNLPRAMLGEVLEQAVVLDRAAVLEEAGYLNVRTLRMFPDDISMRNLGIVAYPTGAHR